MKKFFYFFALFMLALPAMTSCNLNNGKGGDSELPSGVYTFFGVIDPGERIVMTLNVDNDGKIEGEYRPVAKAGSEAKAFSVQGSVFDKNKLTIYVTELGGTQPIQTFNVFASKENDALLLKGTLNNNLTQKVSNVTLSTDKNLVENLEAPSVAAKKETSAQPKVEKKKLDNTSPFPIAPGNHKFKGKAEGKWPIVVYLNVSRSGDVSGKMAYESTLKKYGDTSDHYMQLNGYFSGRTLHLTGEYADGNGEEWDLDCSDNGYTYRLKGWSYNYNRDKEFTIDVKGE